MKTFRKLVFTCGSFALLLSSATAAADVVSGIVVDGELTGHNAMITFDDIFFAGDFDIHGDNAAPRVTPLSYQAIDQNGDPIPGEVMLDTYPRDAGVFSLAIGPEFAAATQMVGTPGPTTRFIKSPLLATVGMPDPDGRLPETLGVTVEFEIPSAVFGFSFGMNDKNQPQNGVRTRTKVGWVRLFNEHGRRIGKYPLYPSRLFCCTEVRFDYTYCARGGHDRAMVKYAEIEFDYDYTPFDPSGQNLMVPKFFGLDDLTYSTAPLDCPRRRVRHHD